MKNSEDILKELMTDSQRAEGTLAASTLAAGTLPSPNVFASVETKKYNRQLFENHPELSSDFEQDKENELYNSQNPNLAILHERPWHRAVAYLVSQGATNREVAARFGKTEAWISQLTRQPWFQERVTRELKEAGVDQITALLKAETLPSIMKVVGLRDNAKSEAVQLSAAFNLIDRFCGKPTQKVESKATVDISATVEHVETIDRETAIIEAQLAQLSKKN